MTLTRLAFLAVAGLAANQYLKQSRNRPAAAAGDGPRSSASSAAAQTDVPARAAAGGATDSPNAAERLPAQGLAAGLDDGDEGLSAHAAMPGSSEFLRGA